MSDAAEIMAGSVLPTMPAPGSIDETVLTIGEPGAELIGVLARPADAAQTKPVGVVIVVGGPQTRVGSHRQFTIMARALAAAGHPCLRFDYTGMGDSPGPKPDFEKTGADIARACDALLAQVPECRRIALWGLCDGATAAIFHAHESRDPRIAAVIAANPWARSEATRAQAIVSGHYGSRLRSAEFWKRVLTGKVNLLAAGSEALANLMRARGSKGGAGATQTTEDLPGRLSQALSSLAIPVRLQLSGRDLTAAEFEIAMVGMRLPECPFRTAIRFSEADHTFSEPTTWRSTMDDLISTVSHI